MKRCYDYQCDDCFFIDDYIVSGDTLEEVMEKTVTCTKCGSTNTQRMVSAPGGIKTGFANSPKTFTKKSFKRD